MNDITCEKCVNLKNGWCEKIIDSPDKFRKRDCQYYKAKTNADRIRNMSDEELAEFISQVATDCYDSISYGAKEYTEVWDDERTALEWLQKEVEE